MFPNMPCFTIDWDYIRSIITVQTVKVGRTGIQIWALDLDPKEKNGRVQVTGMDLPRPGEVAYVDLDRARPYKDPRTGLWKLAYEPDAPVTDEMALVLCETKPGYRGSMGRTGDVAGRDEGGKPIFAPFPGQVLVEVTWRRSPRGSLGEGTIALFVIEKGVVWRVWRSGRLYGDTPTQYYAFDGQDILVAAWQDRLLLPPGHLLAVPEDYPIQE